MPPSPHARHPSRPRGSGRAAELGHYREGGRDRETLGSGGGGMGEREPRGHPGSSGSRAACGDRHVEERGGGWRQG